MPPSRTAFALLLALALSACAGQSSTPVRAPLNVPSPTRPLPSATPLPTTAPSPTPAPVAMQPAPQARETLLLAHYMPWYQTPEFSGAWGWHWTMDHFDPTQGQIASHYTPLTGPYDSLDPDLLEYQVLLMKLAGIDGVIVDWYGTADFWDYASINRATAALFEAARQAGLKFAVCYEDQTLKHMLDNGRLQPGEDIAQAQADLRFLQQNWFQDPAYLKQDGRPVLLVFGPQHFKEGAQWQEIFSANDPAPYLVSEDTLTWGASQSSYPWPPMSRSSGGELSQKALDAYLDEFYLRAAEQPYRVAGAFPGFNDIYQEAGVSAGYGVLDARAGDTFRHTLQIAVETGSHAIQIITWNDYGEGTQIEPAEEYGYLYLEILQEFRRQEIQPGFSPRPADLRMPLELFRLRKLHAGDEKIQADLDRASVSILNGDFNSAVSVLSGLK